MGKKSRIRQELVTDSLNRVRASGRLVVSRHDLAEMLDVHVNTIDRMIASGQVRAVKLGAAVRIPLESIEKLLGAQK